MENIRLVKKIVVLNFFFTITLYAGGLADYIRDNLDGSIISTNAGYYKTQVGGYWTAGSYKVRWDLSGANINLFHAEAPSFNVGCNGVDATFGSFSYLGTHLVDKLKKISSVSLAMAFQMALMTLCEQCNTIMTNLEKIADSLNNFNLNACQASKALARKMCNSITRLGGAKDASDCRANSKEDPRWGFTKALESWSNAFSSLGKEGFHNTLGHGSVLNKISETYEISFMDKDEFIAIMRALLGDIYGFDNLTTDSSGADQSDFGKFQFFYPILRPSDFIDFLANGGKLQVVVLNPNKNLDNYLPVYPTTTYPIDFTSAKSKTGITLAYISMDTDKAFVPMFKAKIASIIDKIKTHTPLTTDDLNFINSMPFPLYRYANVEASLQTQITDDVAEYLAYKSIRAFAQSYFKQLMKASGSLLQNPDFAKTMNKTVSKWTKNIVTQYRNLIMLLDKELASKEKSIEQTEVLIERYKKLENQMIKYSPIWASTEL